MLHPSIDYLDCNDWASARLNRHRSCAEAGGRILGLGVFADDAGCPSLPGCVSQGRTIEKALENIKDAMQGCLDVLESTGEWF